MKRIIKLEGTKIRTFIRKRVAAYARVSSDKDAQLHSLSAQVSYYNSYIGSREDWEFAGVYADEALTGTKDNRPEFQRMLQDCREGKIDMIITKSITRFARNTVTLLATVRELRDLGIDVYFEKENIHTLSADGELMITLLAAYAQEESYNVSENQKWRIRRMFERGRPNTGRMLGYRLKDGVLRIVPEEAEIVKMIFNDYLSGMGRNAIMKKLVRMGVPTLSGGQWRESTVLGILTNEKYTGDMLLQKTYSVDHLTKKQMINHGERRRYARVSTEQDEQQSSYEAQVDFYTRHIKNNPEWEFAGVYTDEGISGTSTKKREGFNRMIADALDGKIDLILTKSISRFARNTVDSLTAIRKLKEKGVEVYFEKENIHTMDAKGELMITIMSSLAQEESRSISENVRWGKRKSMADGKFSLAYSRFLGYEKGEDGTLRIVEEEAEIIRKIYSLYLGGQTVRTIADYLTAQGIPTPSSKKQWSVSTIMSILQNEKYKGDALLQKTYTADFLTKKVKKNHGEVQQYYVENSHPAIIDPDTFALVQNEIAERRRSRRQMHRSSLFTAKLICGDCGGSYGRKVLQSNTQYRHHVWRCNQKYKGDAVCTTPSLREDEIKACFVAAFNQLLGDKEQYIARFEELLPIITDTAELEQRLAELQSGHDAKMQLLKSCIEKNKHQVQDQAEYTERYNALHDECQQLEAQIARLESKVHARQSKKEEIRRWLDKLRQCGDILIEFDPDLWNSTVETATVGKDKILTFRFRDGTEIPVPIPDKK